MVSRYWTSLQLGVLKSSCTGWRVRNQYGEVSRGKSKPNLSEILAEKREELMLMS